MPRIVVARRRDVAPAHPNRIGRNGQAATYLSPWRNFPTAEAANVSPGGTLLRAVVGLQIGYAPTITLTALRSPGWWLCVGTRPLECTGGGVACEHIQRKQTFSKDVGNNMLVSICACRFSDAIHPTPSQSSLSCLYHLGLFRRRYRHIWTCRGRGGGSSSSGCDGGRQDEVVSAEQDRSGSEDSGQGDQARRRIILFNFTEASRSVHCSRVLGQLKYASACVPHKRSPPLA